MYYNREFHPNTMYLDIVKKVYEAGVDQKFSNNVGEGYVREIGQTVISTPMNRLRFITLRKDFNLAFAYSELVWIFNGLDGLEPIKHYNKQIKTYSNGETFNAAYGKRIFNSFGDQFKAAYLKLSNNQQTRQAVINIWHPVEDNVNGHKDYACNNLSYIDIRNGSLNWTQIMRSNDLLWGLPYNLVQFGSLMQIMASLLKVDVGTYTHFSNNSHIYSDKFEEAKNLIENNTLTEDLKFNSNPFKVNNYEDFLYKSQKLLELEESIRLGEYYNEDIFDLDDAFNDILIVFNGFWAYKRKDKEELYKSINRLAGYTYEKFWLQSKADRLKNETK